VKKARVKMPALEVKDRHGFTEVELGFDEKSAVEEANRCLNCGVCSECFACVAVCERKAIHHEMKDEDIDLDVGAIIVTTGYDLLDPTPMTQYGYGRFPNVYTSLEFERMVNSTGFTEGHVQLKMALYRRARLFCTALAVVTVIIMNIARVSAVCMG